MELKKELRKTLNNYLRGNVIIKEKDMARDIVEKKFFIESIVLLREIEDRRDFMEEELGVDMSIYEEKFLFIIENLFRLHFSNDQVALIQYFIYEVPLLEDWNGKLEIPNGKQSVVVALETPEDLWSVVNSIKSTKK